eukprot:3934094-Rhodomonas_salina.13
MTTSVPFGQLRPGGHSCGNEREQSGGSESKQRDMAEQHRHGACASVSHIPGTRPCRGSECTAPQEHRESNAAHRGRRVHALSQSLC